MAKEVVTRDRFKIIAEVEAENLGPLLAQLAKMGLQNLGYELITDTLAFGKNAPRKVHDTKAEDFARAWIADHPSFKAIDLIEHFRENGRTNGAGYTALRVLVADGTLKQLGEGNYQRADVRAIAGPKTHGGARQRFEISNRDLIWRYLRTRTKFKIAELTTLLRTNGRPPSSATSLISKFRHDGYLKLLGDGKYQVIKRPKPATPRDKAKEKDRLRAKAARDRKKQAKLNGQTPTPSAETAHG